VTFPIDLDTLVRRIHAAPVGIVLAITGGGSRAVAELLERPGGSRVLVEAIVPYSAAALVDFLATTPEQFCSARTARLMAMAAYQRALRLASAGPESADLDALQKDSAIVGIACTASLASDRPKRGDHRVHVAYQTQGTTAEYSLVLTKDRRNRIEEENVATSLILNALSHACGKLGELNLDTVESIDERRAEADEAQQELLHGGRRQVQVGRVPIIATGQRRAVFPGAFNPLHDGHREMARIARERLGQPVEFEISIHNVDKPPLDYLEMRDRVEQFKDGETLWLTRAPTFEEQSRASPTRSITTATSRQCWPRLTASPAGAGDFSCSAGAVIRFTDFRRLKRSTCRRLCWRSAPRCPKASSGLTFLRHNCVANKPT
jgi:nicotinamide mononucleotide (NMN) deamidase PncC